MDALRERLDTPVLSQRDLPKPALVEAFRSDESASLCATLGFWQGIDVPGRTLSLVTIDRLPFPRPDEPLLQAQQARAGPGRRLPADRPATHGDDAGPGAGRLIRSADDRGVVAVFDPRLATAKRYRWDLIRGLPPFPRTKDHTEAEQFLRRLTGDEPTQDLSG